ncbi:MAG: phospholipid carrier-dependent glycosyltransferase [Phycisphaerales bacterium]|nr:phospholipid carrier-dependent glycosyltransferase [Phycisphaerales bacterium]
MSELSAPSTRSFWLGFLLVAVVAFSTRLIALGHLQPWEDEIWSYMGSTDLVDKMLRWETPGNREHSPLPFLEIKITRALLGDSWFTLRLPSALYGAGSVVLMYLVLARWVSLRVALLAALLLAVHPYALGMAPLGADVWPMDVLQCGCAGFGIVSHGENAA